MKDLWPIVVWFAAVRFLYSFAVRPPVKGDRLAYWELGSSLLFSALAIQTLWLVTNPVAVVFVVLGVNLGTAFAPRLFTKPTDGDEPHIGIIDFVWIILPACMCSLLLFVQTMPIMAKPSALPKPSADFIKLTVDEGKFLFDKTVTCLIAYGTVLAGCMAIIWKGEPWTADPTDKQKRALYHSTRRSSIGMAIAFLGSSTAAALWVLKPLYDIMAAWRDLAR
jgi:hypothetical protein